MQDFILGKAHGRGLYQHWAHTWLHLAQGVIVIKQSWLPRAFTLYTKYLYFCDVFFGFLEGQVSSLKSQLEKKCPWDDWLHETKSMRLQDSALKLFCMKSHTSYHQVSQNHMQVDTLLALPTKARILCLDSLQSIVAQGNLAPR